jgi:hypothetical protein
VAEHAPLARKTAAAAPVQEARAARGPDQQGAMLNPRRETLLGGSAGLLGPRGGPGAIQLAAPNRTGLPDRLKAGVEALSGLSMDDVRVHRSSPEPAKLGALAYARGSDIHLAAGQEQHLPHEAWHVVQQKQGRVLPTMQMKAGIAVNDDAGLEREADRMGARALSADFPEAAGVDASVRYMTASPVQRLVDGNILGAVRQGIKEIGTEGFKALKALEQDSVPRNSIEATVAEINRRVEIRHDLMLERDKLALAIRLHDIEQTSGKRSTAQTQALASAVQMDVTIGKLLSEWNYSEDQCRHGGTLLGEIQRLLQRASLQNPVAPPRVFLPTSRAHVVEMPWDNEPISHLHGIKDELQAPKSEKTRFQAIGKLRGVDDEEPRQIGLGGDGSGKKLLKGAILHRYILDNRRAILDLVEQVAPNVALFSLERGGSFLADLISDFYQSQHPTRVLPNVKVPKSAGLKRPDPLSDPIYHREQHHLALILNMMDTEEGHAFKQMRTQVHMRAPVVRIAIAETAVSGSSVNTLLKTLTTYHDLLPYSQFDLLVEKQTIKEKELRDDEVGGLRLYDPGIQLGKNVSTTSIDKIRMFIAQTEYILGEDVGYQISYDGRLVGEPLVVFDETSHMLVAVKLSARGMLPRDLLRMLIGGALDTALSRVFV